MKTSIATVSINGTLKEKIHAIAKAGFDTVNSSGVIGSKAQSVGLGLLPAAIVIIGDGLTMISAVYVSSGKHPLSLFVVVTV